MVDIAAATLLGLSAGSLLAEGAVLVPYWRSLTGEAFLAWYREHGGLLIRFFGPLEIAAALLAMLAALVGWLRGSAASPLFAAASVLALAVLVAFPLYFKRANTSFADGTLAPDQVASELTRWSRWHWLRTLNAMAAFVAALFALRVPV